MIEWRLSGYCGHRRRGVPRGSVITIISCFVLEINCEEFCTNGDGCRSHGVDRGMFRGIGSPGRRSSGAASEVSQVTASTPVTETPAATEPVAVAAADGILVSLSVPNMV